jgi:D-alanine-D-alanine ligase
VATAALRMAEAAHAALGCRGLTRSDLRYDDVKDVLVLLEVNTQPGFTPTSLAPEQAAHLGMDFDRLVLWIVEDASCPR